MKKVIIGLIIAMIGLIGLVAYLGNRDLAEQETEEAVEAKEIVTEVDVPEDQNPVATIKLEGYDEMTFELFPMQAPQSVYNFVELADSGFYDGLTMHRLVQDFVIQGGDPDGTGAGGPGYSITGEFDSNGYYTELSHEKGALAWARSAENDSAGSQFYICLDDISGQLDGDYAVFGYMLSGEEVLDEINDKLVEDAEAANNGEEVDDALTTITIESVTVDTKGIEYPEPTKIEE